MYRGFLARRDINGEIRISIQSASGLPAPLVMGKINPYVIVELLDKDGLVRIAP